jgi:hypothetical protein
MNGYLLLGKVLVSQTLPANKRNPFSYATSAEYKYINWKRMYIQQKNAVLFLLFRTKLKNRLHTSFIVF